MDQVAARTEEYRVPHHFMSSYFGVIVAWTSPTSRKESSIVDHFRACFPELVGPPEDA
jgi:hypothetical protein